MVLLDLWRLPDFLNALIFFLFTNLIVAPRRRRPVSEAVFLADAGMSPYAGDAYHGSPLLLVLLYPFVSLGFLSDTTRRFALRFLLVVLDVLIAVVLRSLCLRHLCFEARPDSVFDVEEASLYFFLRSLMLFTTPWEIPLRC